MPAFYTPLQGAPDAGPLFKGATLLFPAVSIGSVPQLAVDLLLTDPALQLRKVGRIDPTFCIPFAGPAEAAAGDTAASLATALEVFANGRGLVVVQQRAPVLKARQAEFVPLLADWIAQSAFAETLWISSIDAAARTDAELETPILSLFGAAPRTPLLTRLQEQYPPFAPSATGVPHIPGALLTRKFVQQAPPNAGAVLFFAAEGDTRPHAHALASTIAHLLTPARTPPPFAEPPSWQYLFGNPPDSSLYG